MFVPLVRIREESESDSTAQPRRRHFSRPLVFVWLNVGDKSETKKL